jgi:hypothetical protein
MGIVPSSGIRIRNMIFFLAYYEFPCVKINFVFLQLHVLDELGRYLKGLELIGSDQ